MPRSGCEANGVAGAMTGAYAGTVIHVATLELDIVRRRARIDDRDLRLTPTEVSLLYVLATNAGRVLTRNDILDRVWGADYDADSNVVDHHIRNLRAKLHDDWRRPRYIATVPGAGYRFLLTRADRGPIVASRP